MRIIPVVTVKDGRPVTIAGRHATPWETPYPDGGDDLIGLLRHLYVRFGAVLIEDAGEGQTKSAHHPLYQKLAKQQVEVWVDGYAETLEDIMDHFVSGADTVIVRTHTIPQDDLDDALEVVDGNLLIGYGGHDENGLIKALHDHPPEALLHAGASGLYLVDASGKDDGFNPSWLRHAPKDADVHVRTECSSPGMAQALLDEGAATVLLGRSLFADLEGFAALAKELRDAAADDEDDEDDDKNLRGTEPITAREGDVVTGAVAASTATTSAATVTSHVVDLQPDDEATLEPDSHVDDA